MGEVLREILWYADKCITGAIPSCKAHKDACRRLKKDAARINDPDFPYYWDDAEAKRIVDWFHLLYHSKGELAGRPIDLTDWQKFLLCQLYGWRRKADGKRRFRKLFAEVARKNAKSQMLGGVALYEVSVTATANKEAAEVYVAGTKRAQSKIVFDECNLMLNGSPLRGRFVLNRSEIRHEKTGSFVRTLSKDDKSGRGDGSNPAVIILDEYHAHPDTSFYDLAIGSNTKSPLLAIITTAGVDLNAPCYREYQYCKQVLDPNVDVYDDAYLIDICEMDKADYSDARRLKDESLWVKANPIRAAYPEGREAIRATYEKAMKVQEEMPMCLTKNFNIWVQAKQAGYMNMERFKACEVKELPVDIRGLDCYVGIDISAKIDLTAACIVIPYMQKVEGKDGKIETVQKFIIKQHSFIPNREKLTERVIQDKQPYDAWEEMGLLSITDSVVVDQHAVRQWVEKYAEENGLNIVEWCVDPHNAILFETELAADGETVVECYQSMGGLNDATVAFREDVYMGNVYYEPDPLLNFCMANAIIKKKDGKIKIDKEATKAKIDPVDALICAYKFAKLMPTEKGESEEEARRELEAATLAWLNADW